MLQKLLTKPVKLDIDGRIITFATIEDFEFALESRTTIPLEKINDAIASTPQELARDLNAITVAIENIEELIEQSSASGDVTLQLKAINPVIFSSDNGWRDIFQALKKDRSADSSLYKQVALKGYLAYLNNRQVMLHSVKARLEKETGEAPQNETAFFETGELDIVDDVDCKSLGAELGMTRIGNGQSVELNISHGDEISLLLANYRCRLVNIQDEYFFIDHCKDQHLLKQGENKIGRSNECTVRFIDTMHRISRLHLIINVNDNNTVELTDLSTYGTHYLEQVPSKV